MLADKDNVTALLRSTGAMVVLLVATTCGAKPTTKSFDPPLAPDVKTLNTAALQIASTLSVPAVVARSRLRPVNISPARSNSKTTSPSNLTQARTLLGSTNPLDYRNPDPFTAGDAPPWAMGSSSRLTRKMSA